MRGYVEPHLPGCVRFDSRSTGELTMSEHYLHEEDFHAHRKDRKYLGQMAYGHGSRASHGMTRHERRDLERELREFPMFARCSASDLGALIAQGQHFSLPANWPMVVEATPADACYVITEGSARVLRAGSLLAELGRGDVVGEMAVLTGSLRRATVSTMTRVVGLRVGNDDLLKLFHQRPSLLDALRAEFEHRAIRAQRTFQPAPLQAFA